MEQRNNDGHDESSLIGMVRNLNRHKAYRVSGGYTLVDTQQNKDRFITQRMTKYGTSSSCGRKAGDAATPL